MTSTTPIQALEIVLQRWKAQWGATTPFVFDNEDQVTLDKGSAPWIRLYVRSRPGGQDTLGPKGFRIFRRKATVVAQVFTPKNSGLKRGSDLALQARNIFEGESVSGLDFFDGQVSEIGPDGKWYQHSATIDFEYDETK